MLNGLESSELHINCMTIIKLLDLAATPLGTLIGGKVLNSSPMLHQGQLHNYTMVYIIGASAHLICLVWLVFRVNEKKDMNEFEKRFCDKEEGVEMETRGPKGPVVCEKRQQFEDNKHIHPLKLLFNWRNVTDMFKTCCKPRPNYVRCQIWLLFLSMLCYIMVHVGPGTFLYPFVQKVYEWNSDAYTTASAIGNVITALVTLLAVPILIRV